jgi:hypothetical protein
VLIGVLTSEPNVLFEKSPGVWRVQMPTASPLIVLPRMTVPVIGDGSRNGGRAAAGGAPDATRMPVVCMSVAAAKSSSPSVLFVPIRLFSITLPLRFPATCWWIVTPAWPLSSMVLFRIVLL